jgi:hypothetical protein
MLHHHRRFAVTVVPSMAELTEKLIEHTWTLCTCFAYQGLLLANDSFSGDGAQEYAVYKEARQVVDDARTPAGGHRSPVTGGIHGIWTGGAAPYGARQ